jgi:hypothetical protein
MYPAAGATNYAAGAANGFKNKGAANYWEKFYQKNFKRSNTKSAAAA